MHPLLSNLNINKFITESEHCQKSVELIWIFACIKHWAKIIKFVSKKNSEETIFFFKIYKSSPFFISILNFFCDNSVGCETIMGFILLLYTEINLIKI